MDSLTLDLDFTGINPSSGLGYLEAGTHSGTVADIRHYADSNRLYVYMETDGIRHRESFSLAPNAGGERKGLVFLLNFLVSAGVPSDKIANRPVKGFPLHNLVGKNVYFQYTPPVMNDNGTAMDGSYPSYKFISADRFNSIQNTVNTIAKASFDVEAPAATNGQAPAVAPTTSTDTDFDFLTGG